MIDILVVMLMSCALIGVGLSRINLLPNIKAIKSIKRGLLFLGMIIFAFSLLDLIQIIYR